MRTTEIEYEELTNKSKEELHIRWDEFLVHISTLVSKANKNRSPKNIFSSRVSCHQELSEILNEVREIRENEKLYFSSDCLKLDHLLTRAVRKIGLLVGTDSEIFKNR